MADNEGSMGSSNIANQTSNSTGPNSSGTSKKTKIVKDVISKGKTITGKTPDTIIFNPVMEEKEKTAVMAFGRYNPPTIGHEKLIHKVESVAAEHKGDAHIIASHSEGNSKNPLPKEKKVDYLKKVAKPSTHVSASSKEHPSFLHQAKKLHDAGYHHLVMVAGSDRVDDYHKKLHQYNGKEGHYNFKSIKVVSAGHRDPDAEGAEGMSGTKMREHAHAGRMKEFKSGLPKALHPHAQEIANHIRSVKEDMDDVFDFFVMEAAIEEIGRVYDEVVTEKINRVNTHLRDWGTKTLTDIYKNDTPGEPKIDKKFEETFKATDREAVMRSGQDRKKEDLVPRSDQDRKSTNAAFRQQSIVKKIIDEEQISEKVVVFTGSPKHTAKKAEEHKKMGYKVISLKKHKSGIFGDNSEKHTYKMAKEEAEIDEDTINEGGEIAALVAGIRNMKKNASQSPAANPAKPDDAWDKTYKDKIRADAAKAKKVDISAYKKKAVDEARRGYAKGYKSPWDKIEKAKPGIGARIDAHVDALKKNADDYQAILDREKKNKESTTEEVVNSVGSGGVRGLGYVTGEPLVDEDGEDNYLGKNIADAETHNDIIKSKVNTHFAMHINTKKPAIKEEIDRSAFLYMEPKSPKNTFAQCGTCESFLPGKQRCSVFSANDKVVAEGSCGLYVHGKPHDDQPFTNSATPKTAGYVDESVRCENCSWYSKGKCGLYEELNKKMGDAFKLDPNVNEKGCCNAWEGKSLNEQETHSIINEISIELIGKVNKARLEKPAKTAAADMTRNRAVKKAWLKSRVGIVKEQKEVGEDLRDWFKDKWVRMDTKGNIKGDCAREPGEGKPKCLPLAKARAMDKEDRATAARRKRREDPVADRPGKGSAPINVRTEAANPAQQAAIAIALIKAGKKKGKVPTKEEFEFIEEGNKPTNPELWARAKALAKSKFDVYPSAYANGWAAKWYKSKGGSWRTEK